jgi:cyclic pyranopterin phosphate synthase
MMEPCDLSIRFSVTRRCTFRCSYCLPSGGPAPCDDGGELSAFDARMWIETLHRTLGVRSLRFTGGEPLIRPDLAALVRAAANAGVPDIALTTNGAGLAERAVELRAAGLQRVNVSLDSLDAGTFASITRGGVLHRTLDGIQAALDAGLGPVKLNMVVLRGMNNEEVSRMLDFALEYGCHVRFLELMPIGVAAAEFDDRFVSTDEVRDNLRQAGDWRPLPRADGDTSRNWLVRDSSGRETVCGFISPHSRPFCDGCRRIRLSADGRIVGCLLRGGSLDLRAAMHAAVGGHPGPLRDIVGQACAMKRAGVSAASSRCMAVVGG